MHGYERKPLPVSASEPPPCPGGERVTAFTATRGFLEHFDRDIGSAELSPWEINMTNAQHVRVPNSFAYDTTPENRLDDAEFFLRPSDRADIEWLLSRDDPAAQNMPRLVEGILRYKMRTAGKAAGKGINQIALPMKRITYAESTGSVQKGILTMSIIERPGRIPVGPLLGATLLGMSRHQEEPLKKEDGSTVIVRVMKIETVEPV